MNSIPRHKTGNCTNPECNCEGVDIPVVKVGRVYYCLNSLKIKKTNEQFSKQIKKQQCRSYLKRNTGKFRDLVGEQGKDKSNELNALNTWFKERRKEMKGVCSHCGSKSCRGDDKFYKHSIAHLLPKAYFKSVATHPDNWIELCFWKNNCHGNMDNKMLDLTEMNCWDEIITKFVKIYPSIAKDERRRIPEVLLQYLETEN